MLNNKADLIEKCILDMLAGNGGEQIELKRTDLADEVSCAPSQISYVLSTRFTRSRGFHVESQRGLGGYIRITVLHDLEQTKKDVYKAFINMIDENDFEINDLVLLLKLLASEDYITSRESKIALEQFKTYYALAANNFISDEVCKMLVHDTFVTLSQLD